MPYFTNRGITPLASAPDSTATWDSGTAFGPVTLSGGNLTVASAGGTSAQAASTTSHSSGKYYVEFLLNSGGGGNHGIGMLSASFPPGNQPFLGNVSAQFCLFNGSYYSGGSGFNLGTMANGTVVMLAVDIDALLVWIRKNDGSTSNWNNDGSANPATGTNGTSIAAMGGAQLPAYIAFDGEDVSNWTARFSSTSWAFAAPSGFGVWT